MKKTRKHLIALAIFISTAFVSRAGIIYYDYSDAPERDVVDLNTLLSSTTESLVSATERGQTDTYHDYLGLLLDAGNGESLYGWVEVSATAMLSDHGRSSSAALSIIRMAFTDIENESIVVGQSHEATIPEPAVATLVVGFGIVLIGARRFACGVA